MSMAWMRVLMARGGKKYARFQKYFEDTDGIISDGLNLRA